MDNQAPQTPIAITAALLSQSIERRLAHLDGPASFKARMALDPEFISSETQQRVALAVQGLHGMSEKTARILVDDLVDSDQS